MRSALNLIVFVVACVVIAYPAENQSAVLVYNINGTFVGTMNVRQPLSAIKTCPLISPEQVYKNGKPVSLARGIYILVPPALETQYQSLSQPHAFGFEDISAEFLPQEALHGGDIETADVNGDSLKDIVFSITNSACDTTLDSRPRIWLQMPDGTFMDATDSLVPPLRASTLTIQLFDVDGDNDVDIFLGGGGCDDFMSASLLINDGQGHFSNETDSRLPYIPVADFVQSSAFGKIDNNSSNDLVVTFIGFQDNPDDTVFLFSELWLNDGFGFFSRDTSDRLTDTLHYGYFYVTINDVNRDSLSDLIYGNMKFYITHDDPEPIDSTFGGTALYINKGNGYFQDETISRIPSPDNDNIRKVALADVDADGDVDILELGILWSAYSKQNRLLRNDGNGNFTVWNGALPDSLNGWFNDADFALLNDDAYPDLYLTKVKPGEPDYDVLLINNGDGTFSDSTAILSPTLDFGVAGAIFDHQIDGDLDVICSNTGGRADTAGRNVLYRNLLHNILGIKEEREETPLTYKLNQNYPNPFNPGTVIHYQLLTASHVKIVLFNTLGQEIATLADEVQPAGYRSIPFDAGHLPGGVYFYQLQAIPASDQFHQFFTDMKKMVLIK